jgi:hypothetical protein
VESKRIKLLRRMCKNRILSLYEPSFEKLVRARVVETLSTDWQPVIIPLYYTRILKLVRPLRLETAASLRNSRFPFAAFA